MEEFGKRDVFLQNGKKWVKYYSVIDFDTGVMSFYKNRIKAGKGKNPSKKIEVQRCEFFDASRSRKKLNCIRIVTKPARGKSRSYYIYTERMREIDELKVELEEMNGTFEGIDGYRRGTGGPIINRFFGVSDRKRDFLKMDARCWTNEDVSSWMKEIGVQEECVKSFKENDVDGSVLLELDKEMIMSIGIEEPVADLLAREIDFLKRFNFFSPESFAIRKKLEKSFPQYDRTRREHAEMAFYLSDAERIRNEVLRVDRVTDQERRTKKLEVRVHMKFSMKKRFTEPFCKYTTFISVGPWVFEWTDNGIITPLSGSVDEKKTIIISGHILLAEGKKGTEKELTKLVTLLSKEVVEWNTKYEYRETPSNENEGNCQTFVDRIFELIRSNMEYREETSEPSLNILKRVRERGWSCTVFSPGSKFIEHYGLDFDIYEFETHSEFDTFCKEVKEKCGSENINEVFENEWTQLKSFDRAFWLNHLKFQEVENFMPLMYEGEKEHDDYLKTGCPFGDPRETR